jgi:superfamily II DNA or RNA helicase
MSFAVGSLVRARGREWVVLPESEPDMVIVRPLGGTDDEVTGILPSLESIESASLPPPDPNHPGDYRSARLLRDAVRLSFRNSAGPFRSFGRLACDPRPYQLVPLLMALRLDPVRMLIADDVGIGKTVEACLIARELLDRGEVQRMAVLCPPHLAEQWQREMQQKFNIEAELVLPSTARRLESVLGANESLFDVYPYVIVSTDYIKSDRRREDFLRACPELVIVDEAHTCAAAADGGAARHQRHQLLKGLASKADRHLILVTATPHSGKQDAFRSLLTLLDASFASLPDELGGQPNEPHRRRLAAHLVQRRRGDIDNYLDAATPFPTRLQKEESYTLHPDYLKLFERALRYARGLVQDQSGTVFRQRVRWWSALALLRSLASSPLAAAETLETRAGGVDAASVQEADEIGRRTVLDPIDDEAAEGIDVVPGSDIEAAESPDSASRRQLLEMARAARALSGNKDFKLKKGIALVKELVSEGFNPIVFCRFIPTAEYVAEALRAALPKNIEVAAVTGTLPPADRESRVGELAKAQQRVLVCTDCLSEGINLQDAFDAVAHYDLSWNPTRHEQREGRVDRYGQESKVVRVVTYYGTDNRIDGAVLDVLLRKHQKIRSALGISVPVPADTEKVMEALLHGALLRGDATQLTLDIGDPEKNELHGEWEIAGDREKKSRTLFAQHTIKPEEVFGELKAVRDTLGAGVEVEQFVREALSGHGAVVADAPNEAIRVRLDEVPAALKDAVGRQDEDTEQLLLKFALPVGRGVTYLHRTHPVVEGLASYVVDSSLDPVLSPSSIARRTGVVRTRTVARRTTLLLLRFRYHIVGRSGGRDHALLAEDWQLAAFAGSPEAPQWLSSEKSEELLKATPHANVGQDQARTFLSRVTDQLAALQPALEGFARSRGDEILDAHQRVRRAAKGTGAASWRIHPKFPVDVLGAYVYLPAVES